MVEFTETTVAMTFAMIGVVGTLVWYALAWYGIRTLQDVRETVSLGQPDSE